MLKTNFYIAVKSLNLPVVTVEGASVDVGSAVDPCGVVVGGSDVGGSVEVDGTGVGDWVVIIVVDSPGVVVSTRITKALSEEV